MLFSTIATVEKYDYLNDRFKKAYAWLQETDLAALADGRYDIGGEDIYANVMSYTTEPELSVYYEAHEAYFDIQYLVSGQEKFGIVKNEGLTIKEAIPENDVVFFEHPAEDMYVLLNAGDLVVVAPEDAHKPKCAYGEPVEVKKVVVKVKI